MRGAVSRARVRHHPRDELVLTVVGVSVGGALAQGPMRKLFGQDLLEASTIPNMVHDVPQTIANFPNNLVCLFCADVGFK